MQLKDVTPIIKEILEERDKNPLVINTERYIPCYRANQYGNAVRAGLRKALRAIEQAPVVDAVAVVRCKDCANWDREWVPNMYTPADEVHFCHMIGICTVDDFFCAYGKKDG